MVKPTWLEVEQPILEAIVEAEGVRQLNSGELSASLGIPEPEVRRGLRGLLEAGYFKSGRIGGGSNDAAFILLFPVPTERGRRQTGQWPPEGIAAFLALLEERIQAESDPEQRSRLEQLRDAFGRIGQDAATRILTDWGHELGNMVGRTITG